MRAGPPGSRRRLPHRRTGNLPSPKLSSVLVVPRQPSLWFRPASATSLRSPVSSPSVSTSFFGTMNSEMPRGAGDQLAVRPGNLGQHQVDDVLGQLMLAGRDPHLVALEAVARAERIAFEVVAIGHGARGDVRQRRAGLRLGQAHGARPAAGELVEREHLLLQLGAVHHQQVGIAHGEQARAHADRGQCEEGVGRSLDRVGQLHAADLVVLRRAEHARLGIGLVRLVRGLRQDHLLAVEARLLDVHACGCTARTSRARCARRCRTPRRRFRANGRRNALAPVSSSALSQSYSRKSRVGRSDIG